MKNQTKTEIRYKADDLHFKWSVENLPNGDIRELGKAIRELRREQEIRDLVDWI